MFTRYAVLFLLLLAAPVSGRHENTAAALCELKLHGTGTVIGQVIATDKTKKGGRMRITVNVEHSSIADGLHGFHIHQYAVQGLDCASTGNHYNPRGVGHGASPDKTPEKTWIGHVGDMGNVEALNGLIDESITYEHVELNGRFATAGRSFVLHAGQDDLGNGGNEGSSKTGNAGGRLACCTIGMVDGDTISEIGNNSEQ